MSLILGQREYIACAVQNNNNTYLGILKSFNKYEKKISLDY